MTLCSTTARINLASTDIDGSILDTRHRRPAAALVGHRSTRAYASRCGLLLQSPIRRRRNLTTGREDYILSCRAFRVPLGDSKFGMSESCGSTGMIRTAVGGAAAAKGDSAVHASKLCTTTVSLCTGVVFMEAGAKLTAKNGYPRQGRPARPKAR